MRSRAGEFIDPNGKEKSLRMVRPTHVKDARSRTETLLAIVFDATLEAANDSHSLPERMLQHGQLPVKSLCQSTFD